jgi:hypothetical protein
MIPDESASTERWWSSTMISDPARCFSNMSRYALPMSEKITRGCFSSAIPATTPSSRRFSQVTLKGAPSLLTT